MSYSVISGKDTVILFAKITLYILLTVSASAGIKNQEVVA